MENKVSIIDLGLDNCQVSVHTHTQLNAYRFEVFQVGGDNFSRLKESRIFLQQGDQQSVVKPCPIVKEEGNFLTPRLELKITNLVCSTSNSSAEKKKKPPVCASPSLVVNST